MKDYTDLIATLVCAHGLTFAQVMEMTPAQSQVIAEWYEDRRDD